ncbi:PEGA domain-containing protein [Fibrisoma montanum]|uniref:PEGA domain-containing protein n=1 Tax=Fibrisoma montanum TaxID=2305895 RepID=A0A418ME96_9BACT|nr:PEGA domain-containing protein [Fibrisoma montanum]RIV25033.1 PEGA domain-containing protein [Fibrisoma montanum]
MKRFSIGLAVSVLSISLTSCATIFSGNRQSVRVESVPAEARIEVNGIDYGTTPATISLKKSLDTPSILLRKDGYETKAFSPESTFNMVSILNIFFPAGFIVDAVTGAIKKYDPINYNITLDPARSASNR